MLRTRSAVHRICHLTRMLYVNQGSSRRRFLSPELTNRQTLTLQLA